MTNNQAALVLNVEQALGAFGTGLEFCDENIFGQCLFRFMKPALQFPQPRVPKRTSNFKLTAIFYCIIQYRP